MPYAALGKLKKNSVSTTLTSAIAADAVTIPVAETARFYDKDGGLITKGIVLGFNNETEILSEEITITGASTTSGPGNLTGVIRGVNADGSIGAGYAWASGTSVAVMFSIGIYNQLRDNLTALLAALLYAYEDFTILQAIVPDNNPATPGQGPELGNGVNFPWASFSHSAAARLQFRARNIPPDWDGTVTAIIDWTTAAAGTAGGTVKWTLKGSRVAADGNMDVTLGTLASITDTWIAANYRHVTAETGPISPGGSGNLLLLELIRDYANDTDTDEVRFISLRLKYGRTV